MKYCLFAIILSFLLFACNENNVTDNSKIKKVELSPSDAKEINLSEFADSVKFLVLETDTASFTGVISDIIIKNKYVYLIDNSQKAVLLFDKRGKFVSKLSKYGKGPGEYSWLNGFSVDNSEDYVEVIDCSKDKIFTYRNVSFDLISEENMEHVTFNTYKKVGKYRYFSTHQINNTWKDDPTNASIIISKDAKIAKLIFDKRIVTANSNYSVFPESFTFNTNNELYASVMFDNVFYKIIDDNVQAELKVDFKGEGIENKLVASKSTEEQMNFISSKANIGKAMLPFLNIYNNDIISFSYFVNIGNTANKEYSFPLELRSYFRFISTNKSFHAKKIINDITHFPKELWIANFNKTSTVYNPYYKGYLVYVIDPTTELGDSEQQSIKDIGIIRQEDNPIIMFIKPKRDLTKK